MEQMYVFITIIHADLLLSFALFTCMAMGDNTNYLFSFVLNKTENGMYIKTTISFYSENHSKISGHMTSGEPEFLIPFSAGFWREL